MIKPDAQVVKLLATIVRQHPEILDWLEDWYMRELETLPSAVNQPAVFQGRCQVLGEVYRLFKDSPSLAAKL